MQQCPEPDVLERCPAGRRRSFLTCVWSLAEPSASAGHPGSMHHLPLLRVQQRTVCAAQLRDCCGYHDWRSGRSAAGARYQHYASLLTKIRYSEHWYIGCTTVNTFSYVNQMKLTLCSGNLFKSCLHRFKRESSLAVVNCCERRFLRHFSFRSSWIIWTSDVLFISVFLAILANRSVSLWQINKIWCLRLSSGHSLDR